MTELAQPLPRRRAASWRSGRWRWAALAWLLMVGTVALHQWRFWQEARLDTDVLALLPEDERAPEVAAATRALADAASRRMVVMIGAPQWSGAKAAAAAWRDSPAETPWVQVAAGAGSTGMGAGCAGVMPFTTASCRGSRAANCRRSR